MNPLPERPDDRVTVVVITRNRARSMLATLTRLRHLPERPPIIVVDNASTDDTEAALRRHHIDDVELIRLRANAGACARNVGVAAARTPYVAFSDDDSWWAPGALDRAADVLDRHAHIGLIQGRILVGDAQRDDPMCEEMAASPLPHPTGITDPVLLGFIACGAIVRRDAFLAAGGFSPVLFFPGEEQLLAIDLAMAARVAIYRHDVVAHHHPEPRPSQATAHRRRREARNALLTTWMRRPWPIIARHTIRTAVRQPGALVDAARLLPAARRDRRCPPAAIEAQLRRLETTGAARGG